jgi:hypothetical protein
MPHSEPEVCSAAQATLEGEDAQSALAEYLQAVAHL